jgi:hypothetical protein
MRNPFGRINRDASQRFRDFASFPTVDRRPEGEAMRLNRRSFLKHAGIGSLAALGSRGLTAATRAAIDNAEPMKITRIDAITFRKDLHIGGGSGGREDGAEFWWLRLHTDKGIVGMGETYPFPQAEIGALK